MKMAGSRLISRGTAYFAVISTINLLVIMAAIANDDSVNSPTALSDMSGHGPTQQTLSSQLPLKSRPQISSLVKTSNYDAALIKMVGRQSPTTPGPVGKISIENSTVSNLVDLINSSSTSPFTTQNWTEIRAQYKSNALIPCHVRNSGDGVTVSWIRRKDYHLLTVGLQTYSSDDRFQAIHSQSPDDWTLKIKFVQPRDAGVYECQVSNHPPSSIFVTLSVVEVRAEIVGGPEKIYKAGSTVELRCDLLDSTEEPEYVFWYQGLQMINYDRSRRLNVTHSKSSSVLIIQNVMKSDTGNYSCVPSNAHPASIFVHIINGENPAAMQHGSHSTSCVPCPPLWFLSFLLSLTLQALYFRFMSNHHVDRYHERAPPETLKATQIASASPQCCFHQNHVQHIKQWSSSFFSLKSSSLTSSSTKISFNSSSVEDKPSMFHCNYNCCQSSDYNCLSPSNSVIPCRYHKPEPSSSDCCITSNLKFRFSKSSRNCSGKLLVGADPLTPVTHSSHLTVR